MKKSNDLSIREVVGMFAGRWWIVVISLVLCVAAVSVYTLVFVEPEYQASTTLYVGKYKQTSTDSSLYNELLVAQNLVKDYRQLVKSRMVTSIVIDEMDLSMSAQALASKINVSSVQDTRIILISVNDTDPQVAMSITNKVADVFTQKAIDVMKVENVQVIDAAILPASPVSPNVKMNIALAAVIGLVFGIALVFLIEFMDRTVKTPDDVRDVIDLPVLGMIPKYSQNGNKK